MKALFPEVVFTLFGIPIRDTVVSTWIMMAIILVCAIVIGKRQPVLLEMLVDFLTDTFSNVMGIDAAPFLPLLGSLAIFIAFANIIGIVPGIISPTKDINTPLALAMVVFFSVHYFGISQKGLRLYLKEFASPIFLLPLEIIGQVSRTLSLTLRLFGNIISGEMIVAIIFALVPLFVPLPMAGPGIFTGLLQAYIFTVLASTYIGAGIESSTPIDDVQTAID
jgi:F-type H+-transporting ATPase subunit a